MEPRIGRAIVQGFGAANRSWAGIGVFIGCWIAVLVLAVLGIALTNPPAELFAPPAVAEPPALPAGGTVKAPQAQAAPGTATNLFTQLDKTEPESTSAEPAAPPAAPAAQPQLAQPDTAEARARRVEQQWLGRAWPMLLLCVLVVIAASLWLTGGQIVYLNAQFEHPPAKLSAFWQEGTRAFGRLLGAWVLLVGPGSPFLLALLLPLSILNTFLLIPTQQVHLGGRDILVILVLLAVFAAGVWLAVRLSFWFIAVVVDGVGPVAGLKASWRATRGRWLKTAGLGLLVGLISVGVSLIFRLIEWLGKSIGGSVTVILGAAGALAGLVASLYVGFAVLAAFIRFYRDVKGQAASPS